MATAKAFFVVLIISNTATEKLCSYSRKSVKDRSDVHVVYTSTRYGHYTELDCCVPEVRQVYWTKWNKDLKQWQQYVPDRIQVRFLENKQIISIQSSEFVDAGLYKCSVHNDSSLMDVTRFHLSIIACDKLARGPFPISPLPCDETITQVKKTIILPCTGYFGCEDEGDIRIVTWYVSLNKDEKDVWKDASSIDKRYIQMDFQNENNTIVGSNLTITEVQSVDFSRKFMCVLATPQMVNGQSKLVVKLRKDMTGCSLALKAGINSEVLTVIVVTVAIVSLIANIISFRMWINYRSRKKKHTHDKDVGYNLTAMISDENEVTGKSIT